MQDPHHSQDEAQHPGAAQQSISLSLVAAGQEVSPTMPEGLQMLPEIAWCASADGARFVGNDRLHAVTGTAAKLFSAADLLRVIHEDDRPALAQAWVNSVDTGTTLEAMVRLHCADGGFAWVLVRAAPVRDIVGMICHWVGIATVVDALKTGEAKAMLIADELAHRIGNIFAVVGGILALSARDQPAAADFACTTAARIAALATAHAFIWPPASGGDAAPQQVGSLIKLLLQPYDTPDGPQIVISGDEAVISGTTATYLTLIIHELATNAAKHGALSRNAGQLAVRLRRTRTRLVIIWSERGGPAILQTPARTGFGTGLIDRVARMGKVVRARRWWHHDGLVMGLRLTLDPQPG